MDVAADTTLKVWDTSSGKLIHTFEGHLAGISTLSWGPDGTIIASGSDDKSIRAWNVLTVQISVSFLNCFTRWLTVVAVGQTISQPVSWPSQLYLLHRFLPERQYAR